MHNDLWLHFINSKGENKSTFAPVFLTEQRPWILKHMILVIFKTGMHLVDKESLEVSTLQFPKDFTLDACYQNSSHFVNNYGVRMALSDGRSIWLGKISTDHKGDPGWDFDCNKDYVTDKEECCYFARVKCKDSWIRSSSESAFSNNGSHFVHIGVREFKRYLRILKMDEENTRELWQREIDKCQYCAGANSKFVFLFTNELTDDNLTILDIRDGSVVKTVPLVQGATGRWSFAERVEVGGGGRTRRRLDRVIVTEDLLVATPMQTSHYVEDLSAWLVLLSLDTFEIKRHKIGCKSSHPSELRKFNEGKIISILPQWRWSEDEEICHMNLTERNLDDLLLAKRSQITSKVRSDQIQNKYCITSYCFKEISTGMYLMEMKRKEGKDLLWEEMTYVEVISWRSEEVSKAMLKFLSLKGFKETEM